MTSPEAPQTPQSAPTLPPAPLSASDERTWAMLAHLSTVANLFTGLLGPVIALGIYLFLKERSRYVAYHAMQSFVFQLIWWVGGGALVAAAWTISGILSAVLIGLLCMPIACALSAIPLAAVVYGVVGAVQCSSGKDFRYWLVGTWVRGTLTG
jgi:uncharacterized Tic20 family protein